MIIPTYHDLGFGFVLSMLLFACMVGPGHCLEKTFSSYPASPAPAILPILDKYFHISYIFFCDILAEEKVISHLLTGLYPNSYFYYTKAQRIQHAAGGPASPLSHIS